MSEINTISVRYKAIQAHFNSSQWILMRYVLTNGDYGHWQHFVGFGHPLSAEQYPGWSFGDVAAHYFDSEEEAIAAAAADVLIS